MREYLTKYKYVLFIIVLLVLEVFYFREVLTNNNLFGDLGDGKFCNLTAEHWFRFLRGKDSFREIRMFFPMKGTIAYSDMLMFYAIPYCILRFAGLNMFLSYKCVLLLLHVTGMAVFAYFLRKKLNLGYSAVLIGVVVFGYSNPLVTGAHTQLYGYFLIPFVILFTYNFIVFIHDKRKRAVNGILAVIFLDGLFYTSFYIGYFLAIMLMVFLLSLIVVFKLRGEKIIKNVWQYVKANIKILYKYILFAIILLVPFLYLELPVITEFGSRKWGDVTGLLPIPSDVVNVHVGNLLNGWLTGDSPRNANPELCEGFPVVVLLAALACIVFFAVKCAVDKKNRDVRRLSGNECAVYLSVGLTFFAGIVLVLQFGQGLSLWYVIYKIIPGASAIRAVSRFFQMLCIPLAVLLAKAVNELLYQKRGMLLGSVAACLIMVQYVWSGSVYARWNADEYIAMTERVAKPPEDCEVMYITNIPEEGYMNCIGRSMDATIIANQFDLECINGYSGQFPKNYGNCLWITAPGYEAGIENWIRIYDLKHVYAYDLTENKWIQKSVAE